MKFLSGFKQRLTEGLRRSQEFLSAELKSVFKSITHKNYTPTLSEGFELTLHTIVDGVQLPVQKSTGENQILSLSFVAAVSKLAREIRKERRAEGESADDAGTYPIVMDAAGNFTDLTQTTGSVTFPLEPSCLSVSSVAVPCGDIGDIFTAVGWTTAVCVDTAGQCNCELTVDEEGGLGAHPGRCGRSLGPGVPAADHDHIEGIPRACHGMDLAEQGRSVKTVSCETA